MGKIDLGLQIGGYIITGSTGLITIITCHLIITAVIPIFTIVLGGLTFSEAFILSGLRIGVSTKKRNKYRRIRRI